jgi:N-acetylmuramoyl-L-alanine amidase
MLSRAGLLVSIAGGAAAIGIVWGATRTASRPAPAAAEVPGPRRWPGAEAVLTAEEATFPPGSGVLKVMIDPGHGAPGNRGNSSCFCVDEQDAMLDLAEGLRDRLEETGHVEARLSRERGRIEGYEGRVEDAAAWGARAFISLHSDVRGRIDRWSPSPGRSCPLALDAPGFAVLYSDEGEPALASLRLSLGRAMARRMDQAGFLPYGGAEYAASYAPGGAPGVFVDRHAPDQRIFVLRRAAMPSILVETHNALDAREALRWEDPETLDAFAAAVAAALADALAPGR